ncbi:MAG: HlyC/CorC family transporter [Candidatus Omnitrophica bacterium]|nr:HlyC/CorC family transporter [Candidatus Omnitrophota bacterium]
MSSIILLIILIFFLAAVSFFFSASETAVIGLSKIRLRHLVNKGVKHAKSIHRLVKQLDKFIAAILIGNDFINIAISAIVTAIFVYFFGYHWGVIIATFSSTFFVLVLCEITPKILAIKYSEKIALLSSPLMERFIKIFHPLISVFTGISNGILRLLGAKPSSRSPLITEEEIRLMIEIGKEEGVLTDEERKLFSRIFEFGDTKTSEVMVKAEDMVCLDLKTPAEQILNILIEQGHSRIPVYEGSINNIVGVIYTRDLLYILKERELIVLQDLLHPLYFVSPEKRVNELLRDFQTKKIQIALVRDKDKILGLVTLEDLLEEIVGEIEEEPLIKNA